MCVCASLVAVTLLLCLSKCFLPLVCLLFCFFNVPFWACFPLYTFCMGLLHPTNTSSGQLAMYCVFGLLPMNSLAMGLLAPHLCILQYMPTSGLPSMYNIPLGCGPCTVCTPCTLHFSGLVPMYHWVLPMHSILWAVAHVHSSAGGLMPMYSCVSVCVCLGVSLYGLQLLSEGFKQDLGKQLAATASNKSS